MKVVATIFAVLLLFFGGSCTFIFISMGVREGWSNSPAFPGLLFSLVALVVGVQILRSQRLARARLAASGSIAGASDLRKPPEPPESGRSTGSG
jgi:hypothetical protein